MKIKVKIYQEDALRKGKDAYGDLEIDIDPAALTQAQRDYLLLATRDLYDRLVMQGCGEATPEALISYLDYAIAEKTAKEVKEKSEHETEVARLLALSDNDFDRAFMRYDIARDSRIAARSAERQEESDKREAARCQEIIAGLLAINEAREFLASSNEYFIARHRPDSIKWIETPEIMNKRDIALLWCEARNREEKLKSEAEEAAAYERKENQLSAWVLQHGTYNQKARQELGFLPEDEVINCIRDQVFAPLNDFERYERITAADVCECEYGACDVEFEVGNATELTADQYTAYASIVKAAPEAANIQARVHKGKSERCEVILIRCSVLVTVVVGEITLSREYTLPDPE